MNNPITVKIKSDIDVTDEQKNELREKLVYAFIEQLRKSGMYKVNEKKDGRIWILRADLILPKKYEAEPVNGWISVKDRLPEDDVSILICSTRKTISKATYSSDMGRYYIADSDLWYNELDITHWRSLPKPPKGE